MNKLHHEGYADLIRQYLAYKRSLGFKMRDAEFTLGVFNRLTLSKPGGTTGISKELFDEWSALKPTETSANRHYRILVVRRFSMYLQLNGYESHIPKLPPRRSTFTPHIYTRAEINAIFNASDQLAFKFKYMDCQLGILPALLRMLYASGLRLGEALKLRNRDVHLDQGYLFVRSGSAKNGQDRMVPISGTLIEVCRDFFAYKQGQFIDCNADNFFFTSLSGKNCGAGCVYKHFRTALDQAGISHRGRGKGPRIHDLRHTFCVDTLVQLSEAGMDLYYSMPILSTYIGHQSLAATNAYVRLTADMYPHLIDKVNNAYKCIFPDLWPDDAISNPSNQNDTI